MYEGEVDLRPALVAGDQAVGLLAPVFLLGDAGYDTKRIHRLCRQALGMPETLIALVRRSMGRR